MKYIICPRVLWVTEYRGYGTSIIHICFMRFPNKMYIIYSMHVFDICETVKRETLQYFMACLLYVRHLLIEFINSFEININGTGVHIVISLL